jgi:hypothetical protein
MNTRSWSNIFVGCSGVRQWKLFDEFNSGS